MPNVFERFFNDAILRVPTDYNLPQERLYEECPWDLSENHSTIDVKGADSMRNLKWRMGIYKNFVTLTDDDRSVLDGSLREQGIDLFAFYKSRRHLDLRPFEGLWGIFYLKKGVGRIAELMALIYPGAFQAPELAALEFLRAHERFHLKFDLSALHVEAAMKRSLYERMSLVDRRPHHEHVEEALANRDAWEWAKQHKMDDFAFDFMKLQPGAYARFDERRLTLAGELAANLYDRNFKPGANRTDQALWVGVVPEELLGWPLCPEYYVDPDNLDGFFKAVQRLPVVREIVEAVRFIKDLKKRHTLKSPWQNTKGRLIQECALPGLDFKCWDKDSGKWSARISDNFRVHLLPVEGVNGRWEAVEIGPHTAMGHG